MDDSTDQVSKEIDEILNDFVEAGLTEPQFDSRDYEVTKSALTNLITSKVNQARKKELQSLNMNIIGFKTKDQVQDVLSDRIAELDRLNTLGEQDAN